jgi:triacylglycerol lipase
MSIKKIKRAADFSVSILNGVLGDRLQNTPLSIEMNFYLNNERIVLDKGNIATIYATSNMVLTPKLCLLIHGVTDNERTWTMPDSSDYGRLLAQDFGYTPFYLRYNTGLHISDNGQLLATILEQLITHYPINIEEICIIAHSMGGLITHSACHLAQAQNLTWPKRIKQIFLLATPHLGSFLEKFANLTTNILEKVPNWHTRLVGKVLNLRSAGIKDMRFGYLTEADWKNEDADKLLKNNKTPPKLLENAAYYVVSGRLTLEEKHWVTHLFGDILVTTNSATAHSKNASEFNFPIENHVQMPKMYHFQLQNSPKVYEQLTKWLTPKVQATSVA